MCPSVPVRPGPGRSGSNKPVIIGAVVAVLVLGWILWPSPLSGVRNLDSAGASIVAFGDSLTAGYGAAKGQDYPSVLSSGIGESIINAGVNGDTTESAMKRLDAEVIARRPRIVIVGLGGNDYLRRVPIATTESNLRTIVRRIQEGGSAVILLGFQFPSIQANYDSMYQRVAKDEGALLVPDMLDGILSNPSLKSDEIHPNDAGYALMADRARKPLERLISRIDS